jgi:geranylgeranyl reductase family protein
VVPERDADVIVVGAGPGGSATAYHLAKHGARVLLLEKARFPREKVCGDGLTPRAVAQLIRMGVDIDAPGWLRNYGLRVIGGGMRLELGWPELSSFPGYGLTRTRHDFDHILAQRAVAAGADLRTGHQVTGPVLDEETGRVVGVTVTNEDGEQRRFHAPITVAADGVSGRLPIALGITKRDDRPIGVAVRRYYRSPAKHDDDYLESWLELRSSADRDRLLPGYGWIFGMGDGRVNVGLGVLNSSGEFGAARKPNRNRSGKTNYRKVLLDWLGGTPADWGLADEANADGPIRGAALPMGFNRVPHYSRGVMLVGDTGGMVNPFNGEGIAYAMESGELAADVAVQALARPTEAGAERALQRYPQLLRDRYGSYFRIGGLFVKLIGYPPAMKLAVRHGMPHPLLMRFVLKLMANLTDPRGGDAMDRVINGMVRVAPAV